MHCLHWKCVASLINYVTTCCQYAVWEGVLCSDTSSCQQGTATSLGTNSAENRFPPQNCMSNVRFLRKSSNWQQTKGITKARLDKLVDIPKSLENGQTTSSSACIGCSFLRVLTMLIMYNNADKLIQTYLPYYTYFIQLWPSLTRKVSYKGVIPRYLQWNFLLPFQHCSCHRLWVHPNGSPEEALWTLICTWRVAEGKQNRNWLAHHGPPWLTCSINAFPFEEAHRKLWPLATAGWMDVVGWFDLPFISHLQ